MLPRKTTCIVATLAALLAATAFAAGTDSIEQRKESIVRVSLEKQGRATANPSLLESARRAAALVSLTFSETPGDTALQIHTEGKPAYDWFYLEDSNKLVIDFHNTINFESGKEFVPEGDSPITKVRTSL
ncbi:MAG: AMIN domain-containing protein, partial [Candidatus Hydrogenedentes bacterium]|nr:AMIN domain-containing protein [Candidatus Hydrogenedentota bacterium]